MSYDSESWIQFEISNVCKWLREDLEGYIWVN